MFPMNETGARVAIVVTTNGTALTFASTTQGFRTDFTILALIRDARGVEVSKSSEAYRLTGELVKLEAARNGDILFYRQPMLPPGRYVLEVAVHDALSGRSGISRRSFLVDEASLPALSVSDIVLIGRAERVQPGDVAPENPLRVGDLLVYPNLAEPFRKTDTTLPFLFTILAPQSAQPSATLELARSGKTLARVPLQLSRADNSGRIQHLGRVPLSSLDVGEHTIIVTVTSGHDRVARETTFAIVE